MRNLCCKCLFWISAVIVAALAICFGLVYHRIWKSDMEEEIRRSIGKEGVQMFKAFDRDDDNYLSLHEFEPIYHHIQGQNKGLKDAVSNKNKYIIRNVLLTYVFVVVSFKYLLLLSPAK